MPPAPAPPDEPGRDCPLCPRLAGFRAENRDAHPGWHNAAVPAFGPVTARLLVVGLAPGLKGANCTGRPFTGDYAGDLLYATLIKFGFARGPYGGTPDDGLTLIETRITNAVRCVPPGNRPTGAEIATCNAYLESEIAALGCLACIVTLGTVAHKATLKVLGLKIREAPFSHGALFETPGGRSLIASYHCSRLNTNTGRLTRAMFEDIFAAARGRLG